jgi:hypothetical protein
MRIENRSSACYGPSCPPRPVEIAFAARRPAQGAVGGDLGHGVVGRSVQQRAQRLARLLPCAQGEARRQQAVAGQGGGELADRSSPQQPGST